MFSNFSKALKKSDAITTPELAHVLQKAHTPSPTVEVIHYVANFKAWCDRTSFVKLLISNVGI